MNPLDLWADAPWTVLDIILDVGESSGDFSLSSACTWALNKCSNKHMFGWSWMRSISLSVPHVPGVYRKVTITPNAAIPDSFWNTSTYCHLFLLLCFFSPSLHPIPRFQWDTFRRRLQLIKWKYVVCVLRQSQQRAYACKNEKQDFAARSNHEVMLKGHFY